MNALQLDWAAWKRVDAACAAFEQMWQQGEEPDPTMFVRSSTGPERDELLYSLIQLDVEYRRRRGKQPRVEAYLNAWPQDSELVQRAVAAVPAADSVSCRADETHMPPVPVVRIEDSRESATMSQVPSDMLTMNQQGHPTSVGHQFTERILHSDEHFGRFRILRMLGKGGMGAVYLAHDPQLDRHIALKIPKAGTEPNSSIVQRFYREAQAASNLRHPGICPVYDVGQIEGVHYLALAYIEGQTLSQTLRDAGPLPPDRAAAIMQQVAMALHVAHRAGIVHRDLKPANIMLDPHGQAVIMDFGLARRDQSGDAPLTVMGDIMGTPAYMSPEQVRGETVGPAGDIYSLGATLYELLTGHAPFTGSHVTAVLSGVLTRVPMRPRDHRAELPAALCDLCMKTLEKLPENRFTSAEALAEALRTWNLTPDAAPAAKLGDAAAHAAANATIAPESSVVQTPALRPASVNRVKFRNRTTAPVAPAPAPAAVPAKRSTQVTLAVFGCSITLLVTLGCMAFVWPMMNRSTGGGAEAAPDQNLLGMNDRKPQKTVLDPIPPNLPAFPVPVSKSPLLEPVELELIYQPGELTRGWKILTPARVPLHSNDRVQIHVRLATPSYLYLYWANGKGQLKRFYPKSLEDQQPVTELYDPPLPTVQGELQNWYRLGGRVPSCELVIAGVSPVPLDETMFRSLEAVPIHVGTTGDSSGVWLPPLDTTELRILRPSDAERAVATREPLDIVPSEKGERIDDYKLEDQLRIFTDYRVLMAPLR